MTSPIVLHTPEEKEFGFPGITDVPTIVKRVRGICNLVWLENLNLRGGFKAGVMGYVAQSCPNLLALYEAIYDRRDNSYWEKLDAKLRAFATSAGLDYVVNDDTMRRPFDAPPILVNFFYHERIKRSARKG